MMVVLRGYLVYDITESELSLALIMLSVALPDARHGAHRRRHRRSRRQAQPDDLGAGRRVRAQPRQHCAHFARCDRVLAPADPLGPLWHDILLHHARPPGDHPSARAAQLPDERHVARVERDERNPHHRAGRGRPADRADRHRRRIRRADGDVCAIRGVYLRAAEGAAGGAGEPRHVLRRFRGRLQLHPQQPPRARAAPAGHRPDDLRHAVPDADAGLRLEGVARRIRRPRRLAGDVGRRRPRRRAGHGEHGSLAAQGPHDARRRTRHGRVPRSPSASRRSASRFPCS